MKVMFEDLAYVHKWIIGFYDIISQGGREGETSKTPPCWNHAGAHPFWKPKNMMQYAPTLYQSWSPIWFWFANRPWPWALLACTCCTTHAVGVGTHSCIIPCTYVHNVLWHKTINKSSSSPSSRYIFSAIDSYLLPLPPKDILTLVVMAQPCHSLYSIHTSMNERWLMYTQHCCYIGTTQGVTPCECIQCYVYLPLYYQLVVAYTIKKSQLGLSAGWV